MKKLISFAIMVFSGITNSSELSEIRQQVWDTEVAFAKTMEDRDFEAFKTFIAPDAVFFGGKSAAHGKDAVLKKWQRYFEKEQATFAWKPEKVEVLQDGTLALSTGPVFDEQGQFHIYTSVWRKTAEGNWQVIFDKGDRYCPKQ